MRTSFRPPELVSCLREMGVILLFQRRNIHPEEPRSFKLDYKKLSL